MSSLRERRPRAGGEAAPGCAHPLLPALSRGEGLALAALILLLTLVPALLASARASQYFAEVTFRHPASRAAALTSARQQINAPFLRLFAEAEKRRAWLTYRRRYDQIAFVPGPGAEIVMRVPGATPAEAISTAELLAPRLKLYPYDAETTLAMNEAKLRTVAAELKKPGLRPRVRRALRSKRLFLRVFQDGVLTKIRKTVPLEAPGPVRGPHLNPVDRVFERLHASNVGRSSPGWSALAGLLLGLALVGAWLAVRPRREL